VQCRYSLCGNLNRKIVTSDLSRQTRVRGRNPVKGQSSGPEWCDLSHPGRARYVYGFAALNVGLEAMAKTARRQTGEDEGRQSRAGLLLLTPARDDPAEHRTHAPAHERCDSPVTSLSLSTIRPSSGSERAFILCIALLRWTFTVASAMPISPAICLLRRPSAT
jgi:hypothetical protein